MRHCLAFFLLAPALAGAADREPWSTVAPDAIRGHVEFLASDLAEGRAAATRGYDIAAAYVAAQFRQAGLEPRGDDDTYFQAVPLLEATPVLPGSGAQLVRDDESRTFEYSTDYLPSADFTSASSTLTAPLVFAGFGVEAPELGHNDLEHVDLQGRIAVIVSGAPSKFGLAERAYYSSTHTKWTSLIARGAVGLITIDSLVDARRVPWERSVAMSWTPQMRWLDAEGKPQNAYTELKLRFRFNHSAAAPLFAAAPATLEQVLDTAEAGDVQGFDLQGMMTLSATTGLRRTESANVLGLLRGADPQLRDEYVVITAHLDHLGRGVAVNGDAIYNGAHDNAVGVAILLEIARALRASPIRPRRSVLFAAVTAEEKGLLGSDFLAAQAQERGERIVANLNIDMPLLFARTRDFVALGADNSTLGALARAAVAAQGYRLSPEAAPEEVSFIRSDQFSFIRKGVPALVLNGGYQARDGKTDIPALMKEFRATHYHQPSDASSLPIDYAAAADLARINLRIALDVANGPRPQWKPGDFFAKKFVSQD